MAELARVLAPGGRLYFSVPIGRERVMFNAGHVLAPDAVLTAFKDCTLVEFSGVNDTGDFVADADPHDFVECEYACGMFEFTR